MIGAGQTVAVGFAGMTHLGLCSAIAAAERGFLVTAFDQDPEAIADLQAGRYPIHEPGLVETASRNRERLRFTSDAADLTGLDLCYVSVDVPTDDEGVSDTAPIEGLAAWLEKALDPATVMVVLSQVPPGFTRALTRPGETRFYQVETLVFGQAVARAINPERFIVGCADPAAPLPEAYDAYLAAFGCAVLPMGYESAELAKIAINMFLVSSVSTTNTLAELCEHLGADWGEIAPALRLDRRIGPHAYLAPGLGIAGGNLERDLATVLRLSAAAGTDAGVVKAWLSNSAHRRDWVLGRLRATLLTEIAEPHVALLGLAYKQDTASTKNSPSLALLRSLPATKVTAFDPMVEPDPAWHPVIACAAGAVEACRGADVLIVMTPWPEFASLDPGAIAGALKGRMVIDPYGILDGAGLRALGLDYRRLGEGRLDS